MKGQGGGGTAKGGGKNKSSVGSEKIVKTQDRKTSALDSNILTLRAALFNEDGKDKNVCEGIAPAFFRYNRNGCNLEIRFTTKLNESEADWAFDLVKDHMEERYDNAGYGWDDEDKERELTEPGARFLLAYEQGWDNPIAFVHFRFTVQGEIMDVMQGETTLYIWDIHVEDDFKRKGVGSHLRTICELIAKRENMKFVSLPIMNGDDIASNWIKKKGGYVADDSLFDLMGFDSNTEGFEVYAKSLEKPKPKVVEQPESVFDVKIDEVVKQIGDLNVDQATNENIENVKVEGNKESSSSL